MRCQHEVTGADIALLANQIAHLSNHIWILQLSALQRRERAITARESDAMRKKRQQPAGCRLYTLSLLLISGLPIHASLTVFVGEPFGRFGTMMPVGHTAIYLDRVCADGPLKLRICADDESHGVVIARYASMGKYDWMAIPVMDFLYATANIANIPPYATPEVVWQLREQYRERYLRSVVPDGSQGRFYGDGRATGAQDLGEWWETAGMAYNRRIWAYRVSTAIEQDEKLVKMMNGSSNRHQYRLRGSNCADFAAGIVDFYYPGAVRTDRIADFGLMTPKQVLRSTSEYATNHPELNLTMLQIPQVAGSLRRSRPIRGGAEAGLKTKRYLFTLMLIQPEVPVILAALYLKHGRWQIGQGAEPMSEFIQPVSARPLGDKRTSDAEMPQFD